MPLSLTIFISLIRCADWKNSGIIWNPWALSQERRLRFYQNYTGIMWLW